MKVCEGHSAFWPLKNQFPFELKCLLCFIDPYLSSGQPHSLVTPSVPVPKMERASEWARTAFSLESLLLLLSERFAWTHAWYELRQLNLCACVSMCVSECWICAFLWRTGKEEWEANLFLCRLTLSFQTPLFSKTPTISSACLTIPCSPSPLITPSCSSLIASVSYRSLSCALSVRLLHRLLWICVGKRLICSRGDGVEIHPRFERVARASEASLFRKEQAALHGARKNKAVHVFWPRSPWRKGTHFIHWVLRRTPFPVQLAEHPHCSRLLWVCSKDWERARENEVMWWNEQHTFMTTWEVLTSLPSSPAGLEQGGKKMGGWGMGVAWNMNRPTGRKWWWWWRMKREPVQLTSLCYALCRLSCNWIGCWKRKIWRLRMLGQVRSVVQ